MGSTSPPAARTGSGEARTGRRRHYFRRAGFAQSSACPYSQPRATGTVGGETAMGEREIREKYGGKLVKAINRAIRAEIPHGNDALDKLSQLAAAAKQSRWKDRQGRDTPEAAAYFKHLEEVVGRMDAQVRKAWGLPPDNGEREKHHG